MTNTPFRGFTLLEYLIALGLIAILLTLATPSMSRYMARNRLIAATEALAGDLKQARSEAIHRNTPIYVQYQTGPSWCGGLHARTACDCAVRPGSPKTACTLRLAGDAELRISTSINYPGVELLKTSFPKNITAFDPVRGTARAGTLRLQGQNGAELSVVLSMLGRVRICAVRGSNLEHWYPEC